MPTLQSAHPCLHGSQMPLNILRAMQNADDFQRVAQIPEEDDM